MKVQFNNKIHFTSQLISTTKLKKFDFKENAYKDDNVYLAELNPHDKNDIEALEQISKNWENDSFAINVYNDALNIYENKVPNTEPAEKKIFYALTAQDKNFENLDYREILGVCGIKQKGSGYAYISNLQVNPECISQYASVPKYIRVGTTLLKYMQGLFEQIDLKSSKQKSVKDFYIRNGFFNIEDSPVKFRWIKK